MLLAAGVDEAEQARRLAAARSWDELYLAFSNKVPDSVAATRRPAVAKALRQGCQALLKSEPILAAAMGERAILYEASEDGVLCAARAATASDQRGAAEETLRKGKARFSRSSAIKLELGQLLLSEGDAQAAVEVLQEIDGKSAQASKLLSVARATLEAKQQALAQAEALAVKASLSKTEPAAAKATTDSLSYESGTQDGMRTRTNRRFAIKYYKGNRDFAGRAEYESKVVSALDLAYSRSKQILGRSTEKQVDVILYSAEEFAARFGSLAGVAAGLYKDGAIHMNHAAEIDDENTTTLVHEYVHATLDMLLDGKALSVPMWLNEGLAEYVEWRHQGRDGPPYVLTGALRAAALSGNEPKLEHMGVGMSLIGQPNPSLCYAASAVAVKMLLGRGGAHKLLELCRGIAAGEPLDRAFRRHYGSSLDDFQEELRRELSERD